MKVLCSFFAETALKPVASRARREVGNINPVTSDSTFYADELFRHVKETYDCQQKLDHSGDDELAGESFMRTGKSGSGSLISRVLWNEKAAVAVYGGRRR